MKEESRIIAEKIYSIENADWKQRKEWHKNNVTSWDLTDDITMEPSSDSMMYYLWKTYPDQVRMFFKAVPALHYHSSEIERILNAQKWVCI